MDTESYRNVSQGHPEAVKPAVEARQGVISGRVILVLLTSLFLSIIALGVGYFLVH